MHEEVKTIESSLKRCLERGHSILDDETCDLLNKHLSVVVDALHAKYTQEKYPGNSGRFERSRGVAVILASILTAEDESAFEEYRASFDGKLHNVLMELYALQKEDDNCRIALAKVRDTFAGGWHGMARENLSFRRHKASSAENSSSDTIELEGLKENVKKAQSLLDESDNFIRGQRLKIKI
jgi:hypothetical protein